MEGEKHPMGHRSCVLGPQVVGDQGSTMDSMAAAGPSSPSGVRVWGQALDGPSIGLIVAGRSSPEERSKGSENLPRDLVSAILRDLSDNSIPPPISQPVE